SGHLWESPSTETVGGWRPVGRVYEIASRRDPPPVLPGEPDAEPNAAPERGGIERMPGCTSPQPPRQVSLGVRQRPAQRSLEEMDEQKCFTFRRCARCKLSGHPRKAARVTWRRVMRWIPANIRWIMLVSGALTCTMLYAAIAPQAALQSTFG